MEVLREEEVPTESTIQEQLCVVLAQVRFRWNILVIVNYQAKGQSAFRVQNGLLLLPNYLQFFIVKECDIFALNIPQYIF